MAALNLTPNPTILLIQLGVFLGNLFVIKKLFLEPYMILQSKRTSLTSGSEEVARHLHEESCKKMESVDRTLNQVRDEIQRANARLKLDASVKAKAVISVAEKESKEIIEKNHKVVVEQVMHEKKQFPVLVESLCREITSRVLS